MTARFQRITPFLWFNERAEEAVNFYISIFDHSTVTTSTRYSDESARLSGMPEGSLMTIGFQLDGQDFVALNGGPTFTFNEAVSFVVSCHTQEEIDHYWDALSQGGDEKAQQCGWLKDRFGVSWQVVPTELSQWLNHPDGVKAQKAMSAMLQMKKLDMRVLQTAVS
jgi:predicted 3-demethylubiquinone-9 3-methyltransferase (glyoxalase superfamily)